MQYDISLLLFSRQDNCNPGYLSLTLPEIRCCLSNNYHRTLTDLITKTVQ